MTQPEFSYIRLNGGATVTCTCGWNDPLGPMPVSQFDPAEALAAAAAQHSRCPESSERPVDPRVRERINLRLIAATTAWQEARQRVAAADAERAIVDGLLGDELNRLDDLDQDAAKLDHADPSRRAYRASLTERRNAVALAQSAARTALSQCSAERDAASAEIATDPVLCQSCAPQPGEVNHPVGMIFVGWGARVAAMPEVRRIRPRDSGRRGYA